MQNASSDDLVIENLSIRFGATQVLNGINLNIAAGEFFAFLGPSGSGKSTLLRAVAGFGPKPAGRILIGGDDVTTLPPWNRNVGMVFQSYALWPHLSVFRNVAFGLNERKVPKGEIRSRVNEALEMVNLSGYGDRRPAQLSGGQQQRVAIARTLVIKPRVLLLDEPLSNLDANLRVRMRGDIRELQQRLNLTTIFVTHDQEEANTICDRLAVLDSGVLQQIGTPVHLYDQPDNLFVAQFLGAINVLRVQVERAEAPAVLVTEAGTRINFPAAVSARRGVLIFRPQSVHTTSADSADDGVVRLSGRVKNAEFLGSLIRYVVAAEKTSIQIEQGYHRGDRQHAPQAKVDLAVAMDQVQFLPAEP
ncbi:MAG: ABC transporter ATP-binding protein [Gammaproteobacteria bacterium]|nr:ABC transporter ATP-binding protein [Gammaproteobacteria bacterium]